MQMYLILAFLIYPMTDSLSVLWEVPYPVSLALDPLVSMLIVALALSLFNASRWPSGMSDPEGSTGTCSRTTI